jgi:translation initiation factor 3 subunit B
VVFLILYLSYCATVIRSDDEDILQKEDLPELDMGLSNIVVVDNLPVVSPEKYEKLEKVVRKIFSPHGVIVGLWMPTDPNTQMTYGYCFIEYNTPKVYMLLLVSWVHLGRDRFLL